MVKGSPKESMPSPEDVRHDSIFAAKRNTIGDFTFDRDTAVVFDDMVSRSVPYYNEIQRMVGELSREFAAPNTSLYDLGCATGTTFMAIDGVVDPSVKFVGIDNAEEMLNEARGKLDGMRSNRRFELITADLHGKLPIENASVVILLLTLQFVRPLARDKLLKQIFDGMRENSCLILVEKLTSASTLLNRLFIKHYYDFKRRNGYSDMEISQKREALENVLIPYHYEENVDLLKRTGFAHCEEFFRWYNFAGMVAVK
jgi:tRNA (cmo5U34)-methyltransferase